MTNAFGDSDYFAIGSLHVKIHACEIFIKSVLEYAFPGKAAGVTPSQKLTLGQLISALKKKVEVHQALKQVLARFLQSRNDFAHNITEIQGVDFETEQGVKNLRDFLDALDHDADVVLGVFTAVLYRWQKTNHPDFDVGAQAEEVLERSYARHGPVLDHYFSVLAEAQPGTKTVKKKKKKKR